MTTVSASNPSDNTHCADSKKSAWLTITASVRDSVSNTIHTFLQSHFSTRRSLVHVRWFISVLLTLLASGIIICAGIVYPFNGLAPSTIGICSSGLVAHLSSLLFVPSLGLEILFTGAMSGASVWLFTACIRTRDYSPYYWLTSPQIAACFTLWPLLVIHAVMWNLELIGLLLFFVHYRSPKNYQRWEEAGQADLEASWKKTAYPSIWKHSVCDIPLWSSALQPRPPPRISADEESDVLLPHESGAEGSSVEIDVNTQKPEDSKPMKAGNLGFLAPRKRKLWRTSDNELLPLVMFEPLELDNKTTGRRRPPTCSSTCRGLTVIAFVISFMFYLEQSLFVGPYRDGAAHTAQIIYGTEADVVLNLTSLTVVIALKQNFQEPEVDPLSAVNITALWTRGPALLEHSPCNKQKINTYGEIIVLTATCPIMNYTMYRDYALEHDCQTQNPNPCWPDIMVIFDYNVVRAPSQPGTNVQSSASVWLGVTEAPEDLMDASTPITLLNNLHLAASYSVNIRRTFKNSVQSFLGIVDAYNTFGIADLVIYGDDPDSLFPRKPNTSSLRLFRPYDVSASRITQDTTVNSFLHGLSNLGGLFTTANAIFLFVFGFGLVQILGLDRFSLLRGIKRREELAE